MADLSKETLQRLHEAAEWKEPEKGLVRDFREECARHHKAHVALANYLRDRVPAILKLLDEHTAMKEALADPNAVHVNLLHGSIARPSAQQSVHIYGEELRALANRENNHG